MQRSWLAIGLAVTACESAPRSALEGPGIEAPALQPHSQAPVEAAADLQLAVAEGRLADARDDAAWLATHEMTEQPGWRPYLDELRLAAQHIQRTGDVEAAGVELGRLGRACAACHAAAGARIELAVDKPPADDSSLAAQMLRHRWASARLWEGVSRPDYRAWLDGATVMAMTPCDAAATVHDKPNVEPFALAERLHDQAERAAGLVDLDARANLYGEIMATCTSCHRITRPQPVVDSRAPLVSTR